MPLRNPPALPDTGPGAPSTYTTTEPQPSETVISPIIVTDASALDRSLNINVKQVMTQQVDVSDDAIKDINKISALPGYVIGPTSLAPGVAERVAERQYIEQEIAQKQAVERGDFMATLAATIEEHHPLFILERHEREKMLGRHVSEVEELSKRGEELELQRVGLEHKLTELSREAQKLGKMRGQLEEMRSQVDLTNPRQVEAYNDMATLYNLEVERLRLESEQLNDAVKNFNAQAGAFNTRAEQEREVIEALEPIRYENVANKPAYLLGRGISLGANVGVGMLLGAGAGSAVAAVGRGAPKVLGVVEKLSHPVVRKGATGLFVAAEGAKAGYEYMHGVHPVDVALDVAGDVALFVGFGHGFKKTIEPAIYEKKILEWNLKHSQHIVYGERGNAIGSALKAEGAEGAWKQTIYDAKTKSIPSGAIDKPRGFVYEELAPTEKGYVAFRGGVKKFMTSAEFKLGDYDPSKPFKYTELPAIRGGGTSRNINPETMVQVQEIGNLARSVSGAARGEVIAGIKTIKWPSVDVYAPTVTAIRVGRASVEGVGRVKPPKLKFAPEKLLEREEIRFKAAITQAQKQEQKQWFKTGVGDVLAEFEWMKPRSTTTLSESETTVESTLYLLTTTLKSEEVLDVELTSTKQVERLGVAEAQMLDMIKPPKVPRRQLLPRAPTRAPRWGAPFPAKRGRRPRRRAWLEGWQKMHKPVSFNFKLAKELKMPRVKMPRLKF